MGGLKPDHKTISEFRRKNKKALKKVLKLSARMCIKLDLIAGNVLFVDGTKIRANASASRTHKKQWYEEKLKEIDLNIDQLLAKCEAEDLKEAGFESFVEMDKELARAEKLKSRIISDWAAIHENNRMLSVFYRWVKPSYLIAITSSLFQNRRFTALSRCF